MRRTLPIFVLATAAAAAIGWWLLNDGLTMAQGFNRQTAPVDLAIKGEFDIPAADAKTEAIVAAAEAFLTTLNDSQKAAALYPFTDNAQRANWSNLPEGIVQRGGVARGDLSADQSQALDTLLREVMSESGFRNIVLQLLGDDTLKAAGGNQPDFGSAFYFAAFLGEPSTTAPWMLQFGGHHLAINVTVFGPDISFAPMLTGGQPLNLTYEGRDIYVTEAETAAAQAFMDSLTDAQKAVAIRSGQAINLLLGPGEDGTVLAPEGIKGSDLTDAQRALLRAVIVARLGFINDDDFAAKMATVDAEIDNTYFGWWGPEGTLGSAYFRVTGPSLVLEYSPQSLGGDPTDHAHNMYREPDNDYGGAWIAE